MNELSIFKNLSNEEISEILKSIGARRISFEKDHIIFSKLAEDDLIGIILSGTANILKYDYFGNCNIIDNLEYDSIIGKPFSYFDDDAVVMATSDCEILFLDCNYIVNNYEKYPVINNNISKILSNKINRLYERVEILSKRTIRDKLLCYFRLIAKKRGRNTFNLTITFSELANFLSVDRSAMMREIKKLKNDGLITSNGKKITLKNQKESRY